MGLETLIFVGIAAGLSFLSAKLMTKQKSSKVKAEQATLTTRGSYLNFIRGRRRVAPVFAWSGERTSAKYDEVRYYSERGWHILGVGPASRLLKIWKDNKIYWNTEIDSIATPSASYVTIGKRAIRGFWIHWGETDQATNADLMEWLDIESRWPKAIYVVLNKVELTTGRWPELEYEIVCHGPTPIGTNGLQNSTRIHTDYSMNPAHVIWEMLYMNWPDGCGISQSNLDKSMFEDVGRTLMLEGSWCNVLANEGEELTEIIANIMDDFELILCQRGNQLGLVAVRSIDYALVLDENQLVPPLPELERNLTERGKSSIFYTYTDMENEYAESDVKVDDDGHSIKVRPNSQNVQFGTITSRDVANQVAQRKSQEQLVGPIKYKLSVNRAGRSLRVGDSVFIVGIGKLRVTSHEIDTLSTKTTIEVLVDLYGIDLSGYLNGATYSGTVDGGATLKDDIAVKVIEMWRDIDSEHNKELAIFRLNRDGSSAFANVLTSFDDGITYETIGEINDVCAGGRLLEEIKFGDNFILSNGPTFTSVNENIAEIEDLSTDKAAWLSGRQLCFIGNEIFYLQKVTAISASVYRLDGLIRARKDTVKEEHLVGDYVFITLNENIKPVYDVRINSGQEILVKVQPKTETAVLEEDGIVPEELTLSLRSYNPRSPKNVRVNGSKFFTRGEDFTITWTIRKRLGSEYDNALSGMQVSGTPVEDTSAPRDGTFRVEVRETWGFPRVSINIDSDIYTATITWADMLTAFGYVPDNLQIAVINIMGNNESLVGIQNVHKEIS